MLSIEVQLFSNGRRVSLEELADLVANRVASRLSPELKSQLVQPPIRNDEPKVVRVQDAARLLGLGRSTVWRYIQEKRIEVIHIGPRATRIRMDTINRLVRDGIPKPSGRPK
jgi:excisionase family DNA binding protein